MREVKNMFKEKGATFKNREHELTTQNRALNEARNQELQKYLDRPEVQAQRKEFFDKVDATSTVGKSSEPVHCDNSVDLEDDELEEDASPELLFDINGWPANIAALKAMNLRTRGTLVVCPKSLVGQWSSEAREKLADKTVKIYEYNGANRKRQAAELCEYDIVITTYDTLGKDLCTYEPCSERASEMRPPLQQLNWHRIIFDESHKLLGKYSQMTRAAQALCSKRRWMVTGTPFHNHIESIATQCRCLGFVDPHGLGSDVFWQDLMVKDEGFVRKRKVFADDYSYSYENNWMGTVAVNTLLRQIMMRHSNGMTYADSGHTLTDLPTKVEKQVDITLSTHELREYQQLERNQQSAFLKLSMGSVGDNTFKIMLLIKRLQSTCSGIATHAELGSDCRDDEDVDEDIDDGDVVASIISNAAAESVQSEDENDLHCSKLRWLMAKLQVIRESRPEAKILIFSQFIATFARIVGPLTKCGYNFRTLTARMSVQQRKKALYDFRDDPPTTIFLLSMRSGAVGLNLTQANHVIIMDPCVNHQLELQAICRVYRLGQRREVKVYRLACKDTVEERIQQMHASGELVSFKGDSAGCLRVDRISLSMDRYRSLLGLSTAQQHAYIKSVYVKQEQSNGDDKQILL